MDFRALSLDPGKTTGYCFAYWRKGKLYLNPGEERFSMLEMSTFIAKFIGDGGQHIIYEDFQFRNAVRPGTDLTPVKIIGVIELYNELREGAVSFTVQQPSAQGDRGFYTDARLKELGVYWAHGKGHARSATKHMLYWLNFGPGSQYIDIHTTPIELKEE